MQKTPLGKRARFWRDGFAPFATVAISAASRRRGTEVAGTPFSSDFPAIRRWTSLAAIGALVFTSVTISSSDDDVAWANGCDLTGAGVELSPWQVSSATDLAKVGVGSCALAGHYLQTSSFTLLGQHTPIGRDVNNPFTGVYDGNGHSISGMTIGTNATPILGDFVGLFGVTDEATLTDIHLRDVSIFARDSYTGGFVGFAEQTVIELSSISGQSQITADSTVGGFAGEFNGGTIERSFSSANVTSRGGFEAGGLVGGSYSRTPATEIKFSYSTGDVTGEGSYPYAVGGLVGSVDEGSIFDSYATGDVTATGTSADAVGGLVGAFYYVRLEIVNSYFAGTISVPNSNSGVGGLVGEGENQPPSKVLTVANSFWDTDIAGQSATAGGGTGKNTAEMQSLATFNNTATVGLDESWSIVAGWAAFDPSTSVWGICPDDYPYLLWQFDSNPCDGGGGGGGNTDSTSGTTSPTTDGSGETTVGLAATGVNSSLTFGAASLAVLLVLMGVTLMVARRPTEGSIS